MNADRRTIILRTVSPGPMTVALCLFSPVVAASLFFVWTRVTTVRLGYALSRSAALQARLLAERDSLRLEVAALKSPDRLAQLAAERGLTAPPSDRVISLAARSGDPAPTARSGDPALIAPSGDPALTAP